MPTLKVPAGTRLFQICSSNLEPFNFKIVEERIILRSENEKRSDDNIEVIKTRLNKYMEETYPVSQFFGSELCC